MTLLILASSSVVRKKILENSMIKVDKIIAPDIDEKFSAKEKPEDVAKRLAQEKAQNIDVTTYDDAIIICADTIVAKGRKILDKALTDDDVRKFAKLKSGSKISCFTGLCVMQVKNGVITSIKSRLSKNIIKYRPISKEDIEKYVASKTAIGKAGGMSIETLEACFIKEIQGCHYAIMGMPMGELYAILKHFQYKLFIPMNLVS